MMPEYISLTKSTFYKILEGPAKSEMPFDALLELVMLDSANFVTEFANTTDMPINTNYVYRFMALTYLLLFDCYPFGLSKEEMYTAIEERKWSNLTDEERNELAKSIILPRLN